MISNPTARAFLPGRWNSGMSPELARDTVELTVTREAGKMNLSGVLRIASFEVGHILERPMKKSAYLASVNLIRMARARPSVSPRDGAIGPTSRPSGVF